MTYDFDGETEESRGRVNEESKGDGCRSEEERRQEACKRKVSGEW